jgi:hypothetical protein
VSFTVTNNFVDQFANNFHLLAQQKRSRLEQFIRDKRTVTGSAFTVERIAKSEASTVITRHGDTPFNDQVQSRRYADMVDAEWGELLDQLDRIKLLADPTSETVNNAVAALNRQKDGVIITAALGSARDSSGSTALPAGQQILVGGTGLTLGKLRTAKEILDAAEQNDEDYFDMLGYNPTTGEKSTGDYEGAAYGLALSARAVTDLLSDTTITSADFNTVRALVSGSLKTFMGFYFVRLPNSGPSALPKVGTTRSCFAFSPRAMSYGTGKDTTIRMAERADKRFSVQVYGCLSVGAVRKEDEGVVQIDVLES